MLLYPLSWLTIRDDDYTTRRDVYSCIYHLLVLELYGDV